MTKQGYINYSSVAVIRYPDQGNLEKSLLGLQIQRDKSATAGGDRAASSRHGDRGRMLRAHVLTHKEGKECTGNGARILNFKAHPQ